jgi:16S rRNA A1518/A1519 N6-dimethyltransferase RsmA/KsgA/DIM1 with predicted DNA glycosylase/AP lyase activity
MIFNEIPTVFMLIELKIKTLDLDECRVKNQWVKKPRAIDLFSGCGGLTLGLTQAGFRVVGAIENDPLAVETYRANHKHVEIWDKDIKKVQPVEVMRRLKIRRGELDLLAGCPPVRVSPFLFRLRPSAFPKICEQL